MPRKQKWDKDNTYVADPKYLNYSQERAYRDNKMDPEERMIHEENLKHRESWNYYGVKALQSAICYQAVADYQKAVKDRLWAKRMLEAGGNREVYTEILEECERRIKDSRDFFGGDMFQSVVHVKDVRKLCKMIENHKERHQRPSLKGNPKRCRVKGAESE